MTQTKHDPTITIVPPICAAKGERHPLWVALTLPVELAHCEGDIEEISEADRTQYNFWSVVNHVSDDINQMANFGVQVTLRGQPISEAAIKAIDGDTPGMPGVQFYDATFKLLSNDTVFRVYKSHHKPEELQKECNAIWEARDVQVSGLNEPN